LHLGVIISGATTFLSYFFAGPPVSFYLAQCAIHKAREKKLDEARKRRKIVRQKLTLNASRN
jgi:hypothetical protein